MTNGDVIKEAFPNAEIKYGYYGIEGIPLVCLCLHTNPKLYEAFFAEEWWNAPYKGSKDKSCSNCKYLLLDKNDENRKCRYCFDMDEWADEKEE